MFNSGENFVGKTIGDYYLSQLLARRKVEIEAVRHDLDAEARAAMMKNQQESIFAKIHKLFGLTPAPAKGEGEKEE